MDLLTKLKKDRITAMKEKDQVRKSALTTLIGDVETLNKGTNGPLTDDKIVAVVKKHITGLQEMLNLGKDPGRCQEEITILTEYVPSQLSHEQIEAIMGKAVKTGQVTDIGSAMKFMKTHYAGQYDGKVASKIAKGMV